MDTSRSIPMLCAALVALAASAAQAQQSVRGTLTDGRSGTPVEGAMVVLLEEERGMARVLSGSDGSFTLPVERPGRYALRVDRIGYGSTYTEPFDVPAGAFVVQDVSVQMRPIALRGLEVDGDARCEDGRAGGLATAIAWEEARKALEAARWTAEREIYRFRWTRYVRELDGDGRRILSEERSRRNAVTAQPFRSVTLDTLEAFGFVHDRDGRTIYEGPDAEVLLSDVFLDAHCFTLERSENGDRTYLGLRFAPVSRRGLPDVEGVLWIDESTGLLEELEYEYVNLDRPGVVEGDDASGRTLFQALPNGTWIVEDWSIRMPRLAVVRDDLGRTRRVEVRGYVEEGGTVNQVLTSEGLVLTGTTSGVLGTVVDSLGVPAPEVRVRVEGTDVEARTDARGGFLLPELGAGTWTVHATAPGLDLYGHPGTVAEVSVERGELRPVRLAIPSVASYVTERCSGEGEARERPVRLVGRVVRPDGTAAADAPVRIVWSERRGALDLDRRVEGISTDADGAGVFILCDLPEARTGMVSVAGEVASGAVEVELPELGGVTSVEIALSAVELPPAVEAPTPARPGDDVAQWLDSVGFFLRSDRALLHLAGEDLLRFAYDSLPGIVGRIPRVELRTPQSGLTEMRLHPTEDWASHPDVDRSCRLDFYLNGSLVRQRIDDNYEIAIQRAFSPKFVTAIEVFEGSESPVGRPDECGYVLLWMQLMRHEDDPDFTGRLGGRVVVTADAEPTTELTLRIRPLGREASLDAQGFFDFGPLPPALYTIEAVVPGWGRWSTDVQVRAGGDTRVTLEIGPGFRLTSGSR